MNKIKLYFENEKQVFKTTVGRFEYLTWWLLRVGMIIAIIYSSAKKPGDFAVFIMKCNLLATFSIPLMRIIFFKKIFLGKQSFRIQTYINIFIFFGSFLGHGFGFIESVENYDKVIHVISGAVVVLIGNEIILSLKGASASPVGVRIFGATGFSFSVMVLWEMFEFFSDWFLEGSYNQNYMWTPDNDMFFFKLFGHGANGAAQYPVLDTNIDLMCGTLGCAIGAVVLAVLLHRKSSSLNEQEEQFATV